MVWSEIVAEDIGVTHVGNVQVVWPIGDDVTAARAEQVTEQLKRRNVQERLWDDVGELFNDIEQKQRARERLKEAGYSEEDIPL